MAEWNVDVPDDLDARLRAHLANRGGELAEFVSRAVDEQLAYEGDRVFQEQVAGKIRRGMAEIDAGRGVDARRATEQIGEEFGLEPPQ